MELRCPRCDAVGIPRLEYRSHNAGRHLGAWCGTCDSWIKWVPQMGEWLKLYDEQESV